MKTMGRSLTTNLMQQIKTFSIMMKFTLTTVATFFATLVLAQKPNMNAVKNYCGNDTGNCGPWQYLSKAEKIIGDTTMTAPFNFILHLETNHNYLGKRSQDWGTAAFINENTLLTAHHVLIRKEWLTKIGLSLANSAKDDWIYFYKSNNDFEIFYYKNYKKAKSYEFKSTDIAVIRILNKEKLGKLYKGKFLYDSIQTFSQDDIMDLTGFPCYFANNQVGYDTLINRRAAKKNLNLNSDHNFIGYEFFTCIGDSGGPIWAKKDDKFYIVGVHHGGGGDIGLDESYNISVKLNGDIIKWLNGILENGSE
jgi:V8-like Glu-specific endopeptidase